MGLSKYLKIGLLPLLKTSQMFALIMSRLLTLVGRKVEYKMEAITRIPKVFVRKYSLMP